MSTNPPALRMTAEAFHLAKHNNDLPSHRIEDCHFIYAPDGHHATTIGVADGVDPGEYAEELMLNALAAVLHHHESGAAAAVDPNEILKEAHAKTTKPGGSTACLITLAGDELRFANVGDSGFKVFRGSTVSFESTVQQLRFNTPAQLWAGEHCKDVKEASVGSVRVESGDVVVVGTDGLFHNLHCWEIEMILQSMEFEGNTSNYELARSIALMAFGNSTDGSYSSPFEARSREEGMPFRGGKGDDITVVVARIQSVPESSDQATT